MRKCTALVDLLHTMHYSWCFCLLAMSTAAPGRVTMVLVMQPPPPAAPVPYGCTALGLGPNSLSCLDLSLLILYLLFLTALLYLFFAKGFFKSSFAPRWGSLKAALLSRGDAHEGNGGADMRPLLDNGADGTNDASPRASGIAKGHNSPFERRLQPAFYCLVSSALACLKSSL